MIRLPQAPRADSPVSPNELALALTGRPYISFSEISTYQACSLKWHFQYVERAPREKTSAALILGGLVHEAIQQYLQALLSANKTPSMDELMRLFRRRWKDESQAAPVEYSANQTANDVEATAKRMLEGFFASAASKPAGRIIGIEETFSILLAPDLPQLVGATDMITHEEGNLIVTDFKTARSMWSEEIVKQHAEQLSLYSLAASPIAKDLKAGVRTRFVVITKAKEPKIATFEIDISPDRVNRSRVISRRVFHAMQAGLVYPSPSAMNCAGCPFQKRCESWHNAEENAA